MSGMSGMSEKAYKRYLLILLAVILAFNYKDRLAFGIAIQSIKADLSLTDTQIGLLTGIAFTFFHAIMGLPLARWADRGNRVTIISICTGFWSIAVALCGFATSFGQLLLMRVGVAIGEAGCVPPSHSLIADYFKRGERPRAIAIYNFGGPLSAVIGYLIAGWLVDGYGWRAMFFWLGLPGVFLALAAFFTLREPRAHSLARAIFEAPPAQPPSGDPTPPLREVLGTLIRSKTFVHMLLGFAVLNFFNTGVSQWKPAFFMRSFHLTAGEVGTWFAIIFGAGSVLGTLVASIWANRIVANNETRQMRITAATYAMFMLVSASIYLTSNVYVAFGLTFVLAFATYVVSAPFLAIMHAVVPARMRAVAMALFLLFASLIGAGLGPLAAGMISDFLQPRFGEESLRYALLLLTPGYLWGAAHYWWAGRTVEREIASGEAGVIPSRTPPSNQGAAA